MHIDLTEMPSGQRYEDRYRGYIEIFERIATTPRGESITINGAPWSWYPLLYHLNCEITESRLVFQHCPIVRDAVTLVNHLDRTAVEVLCCFRPETVDCLWKVDVQWQTDRVRRYNAFIEFIVTNNGSYHRREVLDYLTTLENYKPTKRNVLLVPCAADKPYPSPLHKECLKLLPSDYYMMNATGVVGLVPQDLWSDMPWYDSGIPNEWRLYRTVHDYFSKHPHDKIVVYCDYYGETIEAALKSIGQREKARFILPIRFYYDYEDLLEPNLLEALRRTLNG